MQVELIFIYSNSFIEDKEVSLLRNHDIDHSQIQEIQDSQLVSHMHAEQNKLTLSCSNNEFQ